MTTKPIDLDHADVVVLLAMFDAVEGDDALDRTLSRLYPTLVTMAQEFEAEAGVLQ